MDLGLTGKIAFVTGASKGIGRAVAEQLASEGADIVITARTAGTLGPGPRHIAGMNGGAIGPLAGDICKTDVADPSVEENLGRLGPLVNLVPCAGKFPG